jgi:chorismate mutase
MIRKEDLEKIRKMVSTVDSPSVSLIKARTTKLVEETREFNENVAKLKSSGIINLLETLVEERVVKEARVQLEGAVVTLFFNREGDQRTHSYDYVTAVFDGNKLIVSGEERTVVSWRMGMATAVGKAIAKPNHYDYCESTTQ